MMRIMRSQPCVRDDLGGIEDLFQLGDTVLDSCECLVSHATAQAGALRCCLDKCLQARPSKVDPFA
jgi:hypothetical protein